MLLKRIAVLIASLLFSSGFVSAQSHLDPATLDRLHWPLLDRSFGVVSAQSCAAAGCHGGPQPAVVQPRVARGNEFPLWIENDPHAQSWRTFCSDESVAMMRRLHILDREGEVRDQAGYDNCLACHNSTPRFASASTPRFASASTSDPSVCRTSILSEFQREGVGCSACHGPAEQWIGTHTQDGWNSESATAQGFVNSNDLLTRARMCATCHVGDQDRDMNHDIIAAGHPPLRYEFATYHARQPKHWRDSEADAAWRYEAQLWLAGQIAALDASMSLLEERASCGDRDSPRAISRWPELAAYDCASCHHNLGFDNQRTPLESSAIGLSAGKPAVAIASMWNDIGMRWMLQRRIETGVAVDQDHRLAAAIDHVRSTLESNVIAPGGEVVAATTATRRALSDWVDAVYATERFDFEADDLASLVALASGETESYRTWESATQLYLAAVAARNAWPDGASGPALLVANRLRNGLSYASQTDTPRFAKEPESRLALSSPALSRSEVARLSVELAAWLGGDRSPDLSSFERDRVQTDQLQGQLRSIIERVNETLRKNRDQRIKQEQAEEEQGNEGSKDKDAPKDNADAKDESKMNNKPKPRVKTPQELLDELRRNRAKQGNPFDDE